jgi:hypothetical protein
MPRLSKAKSRIEWDASAVIRAAGGPAPLRRLLVKHSSEAPRLLTIHQWASRRKIPGQWQAACVYVVLREGLAKFHELLSRKEEAH